MVGLKVVKVLLNRNVKIIRLLKQRMEISEDYGCEKIRIVFYIMGCV